jgi:hypothetical protein
MLEERSTGLTRESSKYKTIVVEEDMRRIECFGTDQLSSKLQGLSSRYSKFEEDMRNPGKFTQRFTNRRSGRN